MKNEKLNINNASVILNIQTLRMIYLYKNVYAITRIIKKKKKKNGSRLKEEDSWLIWILISIIYFDVAKMCLSIQTHEWLRKNQQISLPKKQDFYIDLNIENVTDTTCKHSKRRFWNKKLRWISWFMHAYW